MGKSQQFVKVGLQMMILIKKQAIFMSLHLISVNPNDKKNWDSLSKIAHDIGY